MLRQVGKEGKPLAQPLAGARGSFLAAARPVPLGQGASAVLLLAKRIDDAVLSTVAGRSGRAILVSDGKRALGHAGPASAQLETLVGQEAKADVALADPAEHAAAVAVGPGLWLWSRGRTDVAQAAAAFDRTRRQVSWIVAIPLALAIAAVTLRRGRRLAAPAPEPRQPVMSPNVTRFGLAVSGANAGSDRRGQGRRSAATFWSTASGRGDGGGLHRHLVWLRRLSPVVRRQAAALRADRNATAVDLFIDEANLASTLVHPNVVPVFDFGEAAGSYFLAQEYVIGRDLGRITRRLRERGEPLLSPGAILYMATRCSRRCSTRTTSATTPATAGAGPPRHHARERHDLRAGRGEGARLRHHEGQPARVPDRERHREGERRVHVPRAGAGQGGRSPLGSVLVGSRDPVRGDWRADLPG